MSKYVAYFRVSTDRQGASGLGLEAQQAAVIQYTDGIIHSFTEIESGKHDDRPQLQAAIAMCKATGAALLIAKIDRLSRQAAFLLTLRDSGVQIVAADMPHAGTLEFGIRAVVAQHEREEISRRTKAALQAAKARGIKLGSPNPSAGSAAGIASIQASADQFAQHSGSSWKAMVEMFKHLGVTFTADEKLDLKQEYETKQTAKQQVEAADQVYSTAADN
jgi:DNA invertase Pin-like site-specific DNA recombinase